MALHLFFAIAAAAYPVRAVPADTLTTTVTDTTWYVTNRARVGGKLAGVRSDTLEYGYVVVRYRERADRFATDPWVEQFQRTASEPVRLSRDEFLGRVGAANARVTARGEGPVIYTHGFATSFARAIAQGSDIAHRGRFAAPFIVFAWPARAAFASLPRFSALISKGYRDDSTSASASADAFRGALADLLSVIPAQRLTVLAHSLGAQLATEALAVSSPVRDSLQRVPLQALVLFAPDIPAARFRDLLGPALVPLATRRVIYASGADRLLTVSRLINHAPRAGQARGERMLAMSDVEIVDVTEGRRSHGVLRNLFEMRHAMRYASTALRDFFGVVHGTPGECRAFDGLAERLTERSWRLTSKAPPASDVACAPAADTGATVLAANRAAGLAASLAASLAAARAAPPLR